MTKKCSHYGRRFHLYVLCVSHQSPLCISSKSHRGFWLIFPTATTHFDRNQGYPLFFFINRTVLRSNRRTELNQFCIGCKVDYSCPGQIGKCQNGPVEQRIKEIERIARCGKEISGVPDLASSYCVLHAVDILNALPTTANPTDGTTDANGLSPYLKYYVSQPSMSSPYVFGSYCSVHMDDDHIDKTN